MHFLLRVFIKIKQIIWTKIARRKICECKGDLKCNRKCDFNRNTFLGLNCNFNGMKIYGTGKVSIGDNFHSGVDCQIITSFHNYDTGTMIPYDESFVTKDVTIGNNVWIGNNVIMLGGSNIDDGSIIQAGSVVCGGTIPALGIAGGHPAKVFKYRNKEHYDSLVARGKVH